MVNREELQEGISLVKYYDRIHLVLSCFNDYIELKNLFWATPYVYTTYNNVDPIPLTSELLLDAGFVKNENEGFVFTAHNGDVYEIFLFKTKDLDHQIMLKYKFAEIQQPINMSLHSLQKTVFKLSNQNLKLSLAN